MPRVFVPALLRELTGGRERVEADGRTVRQIIESLESQFPGMRERLIDGDGLNIRVAVAVDGQISRLGLLTRVAEDSEVTFVPAMSGG